MASSSRVGPCRLEEVSRNTRNWLLGHLSALGYEFSLGPLESDKEWQTLSVNGHSTRVRIADGTLSLDRPDAHPVVLPVRRRGRWCAMNVAAWVVRASEHRATLAAAAEQRLERQRLKFEHDERCNAQVAKSNAVVTRFNLKNVAVFAADEGSVTLYITGVDLDVLERLCKALSRNNE